MKTRSTATIYGAPPSTNPSKGNIPPPSTSFPQTEDKVRLSTDSHAVTCSRRRGPLIPDSYTHRRTWRFPLTKTHLEYIASPRAAITFRTPLPETNHERNKTDHPTTFPSFLPSGLYNTCNQARARPKKNAAAVLSHSGKERGNQCTLSKWLQMLTPCGSRI